MASKWPTIPRLVKIRRAATRLNIGIDRSSSSFLRSAARDARKPGARLALEIRIRLYSLDLRPLVVSIP